MKLTTAKCVLVICCNRIWGLLALYQMVLTRMGSWCSEWHFGIKDCLLRSVLLKETPDSQILLQPLKLCLQLILRETHTHKFKFNVCSLLYNCCSLYNLVWLSNRKSINLLLKKILQVCSLGVLAVILYHPKLVDMAEINLTILKAFFMLIWCIMI